MVVWEGAVVIVGVVAGGGGAIVGIIGVAVGGWGTVVVIGVVVSCNGNVIGFVVVVDSTVVAQLTAITHNTTCSLLSNKALVKSNHYYEYVTWRGVGNSLSIESSK